jgi:hypothetical protein
MKSCPYTFLWIHILQTFQHFVRIGHESLYQSIHGKHKTTLPSPDGGEENYTLRDDAVETIWASKAITVIFPHLFRFPWYPPSNDSSPSTNHDSHAVKGQLGSARLRKGELRDLLGAQAPYHLQACNLLYFLLLQDQYTQTYKHEMAMQWESIGMFDREAGVFGIWTSYIQALRNALSGSPATDQLPTDRSTMDETEILHVVLSDIERIAHSHIK